jgi:hypothetical protein
MRTLTATELLEVWERGERQHPLDRALTLLAAACPETEPPELAALAIGRRDTLLLALRRLTLGDRLTAFAACPACGAELEYGVDIGGLLDAAKTPPAKLSVRKDGYDISFRLPDSADLGAVAGRDAAAARTQILERCILAARRKGKVVAADLLSESALTAVVAAMTRADPLAEITMHLQCAACGRTWDAVLDILSFFWTELGGRVKELLSEVETLARAYGWREADILAMSEWRRRFYLEKALA